MTETEVSSRQRNRRGQGARLRDDIVRAAAALLERTGRDDAVTLRAVAREAGITAPSIYAHFGDRGEIMVAVVQGAFSMLAAALRPDPDEPAPPVPALYAVCRAYLDFAAAHPALYRVMFERSRSEAIEPGSAGYDVTSIVGADAFGVLLDAVAACIQAGDSAETAAPAAAVRVWVSLHGMATLRASLPWFPWPPRDSLLDDLVRRAADLQPPPGQGRAR